MLASDCSGCCGNPQTFGVRAKSNASAKVATRGATSRRINDEAIVKNEARKAARKTAKAIAAGQYMDDMPPAKNADETLLRAKRVAYQLLHGEADIDRVRRIVAVLEERFTNDNRP